MIPPFLSRVGRLTLSGVAAAGLLSAFWGCSRPPVVPGEEMLLGTLDPGSSRVMPVLVPAQFAGEEWSAQFSCDCLREVSGSRDGRQWLLEWRAERPGHLEAVVALKAKRGETHRIRLIGFVREHSAIPTLPANEIRRLENPFLVDARDARVRLLGMIVGAEQLSEFRVQHSRGRILTRPVILVGDGFDEPLVSAVAGEFLRLGVKVSILEGGVPAWYRAGGKVVGPPADLGALQTVAANSLNRSLALGQPWILVSKESIPKLPPNLTTVPPLKGRAGRLDAFQHALKVAGDRAMVAVASDALDGISELRSAGFQVYPYLGRTTQLSAGKSGSGPLVVSTESLTQSAGGRSSGGRGSCGSCPGR